ncbi:MAG: hypothetical protein JWO05_1517 [Gemmatimonadetes bacterium]|nr:hypothetical protein [Gemmatimonadota bacterium]
MYAIAIIRYRRPLEDVLTVLDAHRAYLAELREEGKLIASGPMEPRAGGILLLHVPDDEDPQSCLDAIRDGDPYVTFGMAQYECIPWKVVTGKDALDTLLQSS